MSTTQLDTTTATQESGVKAVPSTVEATNDRTVGAEGSSIVTVARRNNLRGVYATHDGGSVRTLARTSERA